MSPAQKKVIDDPHCTNEWSDKFGGPQGDFEHAGLAKMKAMPDPRDLFDQRRPAERKWKKSAEPLHGGLGRCG